MRVPMLALLPLPQIIHTFPLLLILLLDVVNWDPTVTTKRQRGYFKYYVSLLYV